MRIFVFFYIFSAFILTQGYNASMMSALTIPIVPKPLGECNRASTYMYMELHALQPIFSNLDSLREISETIDEKGLMVESYDCVFAGLE